MRQRGVTTETDVDCCNIWTQKQFRHRTTAALETFRRNNNRNNYRWSVLLQWINSLKSFQANWNLSTGTSRFLWSMVLFSVWSWRLYKSHQCRSFRRSSGQSSRFRRSLSFYGPVVASPCLCLISVTSMHDKAWTSLLAHMFTVFVYREKPLLAKHEWKQNYSLRQKCSGLQRVPEPLESTTTGTRAFLKEFFQKCPDSGEGSCRRKVFSTSTTWLGLTQFRYQGPHL